MNQVEEESLYRSLEEEAIDVDCLLVEPRSDQVSVSGVWCFEEDNLAKCIKTEDNTPYKLGVTGSNINSGGVDTTKLNVLPRESGVENLLSTNNVSACDDYLIDIGYVDHGGCIDFNSNENQFPVYHNNDKGSFGIQNSECEGYFLNKSTMCELHNTYNCNCLFAAATSSESKSVDRFEDYSKSFIHNEEEEDNQEEEDINNNNNNLQPNFQQNGMELIVPLCEEDAPVTHKRSRKPTKRYIDESSNLNIKNCKKRKEGSSSSSSMSKVKVSGIRRPKSQHEVEVKEKTPSFEMSFGKAIQVPFISQGPADECPKNNSPPAVENRIENYSTGSDDDNEAMTGSMTGGNQRKSHKLWTVSEVKKLIDGVAHFGVGKWTHIKKLLFSSSVHRTPVDLKDKWRNLLKASRALNGSSIEDEQKRSQPWRPLPKTILCRVRELASVYPYPREGSAKISKSKFPLERHVSSPARIKGNNKVPVV